MKLFVIGATGLVGSYLIPKLIEKGHEVYALTRSENKIGRIKKLGASGIVSDIRDPKNLINKLPQILDAIVLLAMPSVTPGKRITKKRKIELREETNDFFKNSMDLAIRYEIPVILPGGTSYRTRNDEIADETWPIRRVGITEIGTDTDEMVAKAILTGKPRVIQLIYGKIYGNGGLFRIMYDMVKKGKIKIIGNGNNYIPNIHASDAASAIVQTITKMPVGEKFIIVDDTPATQKEFTSYLAHLLHKKEPGKIPGFIVRWVIGHDLYEVVNMNCKVTNSKAKKILDWAPQFPSFREGLDDVVSEMNEKEPYFG
jgi:nucleoside-diphosphate-sugar epimerase